ncbi:AfsR/SARP family transcriptional regulator [Kibdelosporangium phytohabitans]|uniref:OmpR/PhoB-type domain-containing protein n=1 Tax=Kibdelosporangium phytohabitans TaxID=860235 RepID=A0A0N7F4I8_9PSEU|nr:BTAD domain-containing putative transcriptional regulator [Kibdelosporangium phytohabitans]ALG11551.1 hypothetical protein AOZ06_35970 [Kibdelosporangium phytohabitans]MBE1462915.1 DNA-binding SARP family transcriptional activator/Tfp pilus assembly protein PilF [Kibdelosporangium phytohabitans]
MGPLGVDSAAELPKRRKQRQLLALLLFHANSVLRTGFLLDALWDADRPVSAGANLQSYVAGLRRVIGSDRLENRRGGYVLHVADDELDATVFTELTATGRVLLQAGDPSAAVAKLTAALDLWRGPVLDGLPVPHSLRGELGRLDELRVRASEDRVQARLELGGHSEAAVELRTLLAQHPFRERLWSLLMLALYRLGRQDEALDAYARMRRSFVDELGIEPGVDVRRMHQRILGADPALDIAPEPEPAAQPVPPRLLPPDVAYLAGREKELATLDGLLGTGRAELAVVVGSGGIGKTSLVVRWAHRVAGHFPDGQLFIDLRGHESPMTAEQALTQLLRVLGTACQAVPVTVDEQVALYRSLLADRKVLVVLDNAGNAEQCRPLLPSAPGCAAVVTSRADLRGLTVVNDARMVRLDVLGAAEARALLAELIGDEPDAITELAHLCGYLPLALRIAAANLLGGQHATVLDYVTALREGDRMAILAIEGDPSVAVRATFLLSYRALDATTARVFRLLGAAACLDFTVHAAAAACGLPGTQARRSLDRLVAANLLAQRGSRYHFHDLIREFAASQCAGEDSPADRRASDLALFDHYLGTVDQAVITLYPGTRRLKPLPTSPAEPFGTETAALGWLDLERANLLAAVKRAASLPEYHAHACHLADAMRGYFQAQGHAIDGLAICEAALSAARYSGDALAEASILDLSGLIHYNLSDYLRAIGLHTAALEVTQRAGDKEATADSLHNLGRVYAQLGRPAPSMLYHKQALEISQESGNRTAEALALNYIGAAYLSFGDAVEAVTWHERARDLSRQIGNRYSELRAINGLGLAHWTLGRIDEAAAHHRESLEACRTLGYRHGELISMVCLAETYCDAGRHAEAAEIADEAITMSLQLGERRNEASAIEVAATIRQRLGDFDGAIEGYANALALARRIGFGYGETSTLIGMALAHIGRGNPETALEYGQQARARIQNSQMRVLEPQVAIVLAFCQIRTGQAELAATSVEQAIALARQGKQRLVEARALHVQAVLQTSVGDTDAAHRTWSEAMVLFAETGAKPGAVLTGKRSHSG